jgi:hypothetical protein
MSESEEDQRCVAAAVPSCLGSSGDQSLDLRCSEVFAAAALQVGRPARRGDFPIFDCWRPKCRTLEFEDIAYE